jgi:hypothetical protein
MIDDKFKLREKSDADLHAWLVDNKPGSEEYIAGIKETMRRVAIIEELIERTEDPVRHRELIAAGLAILALTVIIIAIIVNYQ